MLVFTIDDFLQIGFFQLIYIILLIYLTRREFTRKPRKVFSWIILAIDAIYIILILVTIRIILHYIPNSKTDAFGWMLYLLVALGPGLLILFAVVTYEVAVDINKYLKIIFNKTRT